MSEILGWLALTVITGLLWAIGSLIDWKSVFSKYLGDSEDGDTDQR